MNIRLPIKPFEICIVMHNLDKTNKLHSLGLTQRQTSTLNAPRTCAAHLLEEGRSTLNLRTSIFVYREVHNIKFIFFKLTL